MAPTIVCSAPNWKQEIVKSLVPMGFQENTKSKIRTLKQQVNNTDIFIFAKSILAPNQPGIDPAPQSAAAHLV